MRLLRYVPLLFVFGLNACMWGAPKTQSGSGITKDTLAYTYKTIKEKQSDCGNRPDSVCTIVNISYPVFKGQPKLNDTINHINILNDEPDSNLNQFAKNYLAVQKIDFNKPDNHRYSLDLDVNVIRQDSDIVTIKIEGDTYYAGSPHQNLLTSTYYINWDTKLNKKLLLSDVLVSGYKAKLNQIAEPIFRHEEKLDDTASLKPDYRFEDGKFELYDNFLITPLGLRFTYNPDDIKPYAAGQTDLVIPYSKIKSLLLPHTVVSQYIK